MTGAVANPVFTDDEVLSLNAYQDAGVLHPFTCGQCHQSDLVAANDGWHCPICPYTQDWAWSFMKDWNWLLAVAPIIPLSPELQQKRDDLIRYHNQRAQEPDS